MTEEKHAISSGRKSLLIGLVLAALIGLGVLVILMPWLRNSCESIFEQTAPKMKVHLEIIKNTGVMEISQEKIQELSESAQKVGMHLKTCCNVLEHGKLSPGQFQQCIDTASAYDRKIAFVAQQMTEVAEARERGLTDVLKEKIATVDQAIESAKNLSETFESQVEAIPEPCPSVNKTADKVPIWVPLYPGTKVENLSIREATKIQSGSFFFHTQDSYDYVANFYDTKLEAMGWEAGRSVWGSYSSVIGKSESEGRTVTVNAWDQGADKQTKVLITFEEAKR